MDRVGLESLHEQEVRPDDETILELEALVDWILEASDGRAFCRLSVEELPADIKVNFHRNWGILSACWKVTGKAFQKAVLSLDSADWETLRLILSTWATWGISSVPLGFKSQDGVRFSWHLGLTGEGIGVHKGDGKWSLVWTEDRGLECWIDESPVVN